MTGGAAMTATLPRRTLRSRGYGLGAGGRVLRLVWQALVVAFVVVVITFLLVRVVPGDPATAILGTKGSDAAKDALRKSLDLDDPYTCSFCTISRISCGATSAIRSPAEVAVCNPSSSTRWA